MEPRFHFESTPRADPPFSPGCWFERDGFATTQSAQRRPIQLSFHAPVSHVSMAFNESDLYDRSPSSSTTVVVVVRHSLFPERVSISHSGASTERESRRSVTFPPGSASFRFVLAEFPFSPSQFVHYSTPSGEYSASVANSSAISDSSRSTSSL